MQSKYHLLNIAGKCECIPRDFLQQKVARKLRYQKLFRHCSTNSSQTDHEIGKGEQSEYPGHTEYGTKPHKLYQ